jgi:ABC-2 type transport system ATP-binding protein
MTRALPCAVELHDLTKSFGDVLAVDEVSAVALPGEVTALLGPNGAGKTTTLRMLLGLVAPSSGTATFGGRRYDELTDPVRRVGAVLEASGCHPGRTALDHLRVLATASRLPKDAPTRVLAETGLAADARRRVGEFSLGMRQRLGLAAAMLGDPDVLVLDEPTNGLDPPGVRWLRGYVRRLADEGRTVLVSSHALSEVEQTADHVLVLAHGRLLRSSRLAALRAEAGVGSRVRTPDPDRLCAALQAAGHRYRRSEEGLVVDASPEEVGELAAAHGVVLHGLAATADLEQAFFRLIQESESAQRPASTDGPPS